MSRNGQRNEGSGNPTSRLVDSMDQMIRWPFQMTGATWDLMVQGMQSVSGSGQGQGRASSDQSSSNWGSSSSANLSSGSSWTGNQPSSSEQSSRSSFTSVFAGANDQDLSGDDLKYVIWSIVFTKPGLECVLEPQHEEIVNYSADGASFAAVKIARLLEKARHGHVDKPESWSDAGYPAEGSKSKVARTDTTTVIASPTDTTVSTSSSASRKSGSSASSSASSNDDGWRIPADDQKYIRFLYRVDRRLPRQESEVIERVTIERGTKVV